jgi:hypothetical protein
MSMKKITTLSLFLLIFFLSCKKESEVGKPHDTIILSQKTTRFNSNQDSIIITTQGNGWWLHGLYLNHNVVNFQNINGAAQDFILQTSDFSIERINGKTIKIKMNENLSGAIRTLLISLEDGDYFDSITVTQN